MTDPSAKPIPLAGASGPPGRVPVDRAGPLAGRLAAWSMRARRR